MAAMAVDDSSSSFRQLDDAFLQSQARIWLENVLQTRFEEQLNTSDILSDGEPLFEVSKELWNMLLVKYMEVNNFRARLFIPVDTRKSSGRYRPYSNVDSFLKVCRFFGLSGVDLFSPSDVVEKRDTRKVCICIRSLSKRARSKQLNVPDFDIVTKAVGMPKDIVGCIRRSLELSTSSVTCSLSKKMRQKSSFAAERRKDVTCIEKSEQAKSNFSETRCYGRYLDISYMDLECSESAEAVDATPSTCMYRICKKFPDDVQASVNGDLQQQQNEDRRSLGKISISHNEEFQESQFETNLQRFDLSADSFAPFWDEDFDSLNQIILTQDNIGDPLLLVKDNIKSVAYNDQQSLVSKSVKMIDQKSTYKDSDVKSSEGLIQQNHYATSDETQSCCNGKGFANLRIECYDQLCVYQSDTQDATKDERKGNEIDNNNNKPVNTQKKLTYITPLLKTVAKGTTLIGLFFLLQLRNRSDRNINGKAKTQIHWKSSGVGLSTRKGEKGSKIYPLEKFRFGD